MQQMTLEKLNEIKRSLAKRINDRRKYQGVAFEGEQRQILVCGSTGCLSNDSGDVYKRFKELIETNGLHDKAAVVQTGCHGLCEQGPVVIIYPEGVFYAKLKTADVDRIFEQHIKNGQVVKELLFWEQNNPNGLVPLNETNFYKKQVRIALRNSGVIDPENIDEYIAADGYFALHKVLTTMSPEQVVEVMKQSGLRGRGGAGFPTWMKWDLCRKAIGDKKYACCNGDEGDPGAFMDRSLLEADPHSVLEAMAIAGYTIGSDEGFIYVRAEYPIAVKRLEIAIKQAEEKGLLGNNIFGTGFNFKISLRLGSGAFVCGEETGLMVSIEGDRGEPRPRPPYPANKGLFGKPTILNNVETYANVTRIILNGPQWFSSIGTEKSKGTKVFAVGGKIKNTGLIEVPMGTTLREIIYEIGGGIPNGKEFKAAQTGGPSGGCIPASLIDTPIDYENLVAIGSMMGSGGLIVMDETSCMVDICKFYLEFSVEESCGKCIPCRIGNKRLLEMLENITKGKSSMEEFNKMEQLCAHIKESSLCGLGQFTPQPIMSTIRYFRDEYMEHILNKHCPTGSCKDLTSFIIDPVKCKKCSLCARQCPVNAISGEVGKTPYVINQAKCIKCGACIGACKFGAILRK